MPYPSLADRWINEKRKHNEQWYSWQTGLRLLQAYGRSVRSKDDWATTYLLNSALGNFVFRNKQILPEWFTNAISSCMASCVYHDLFLLIETGKLSNDYKMI